MKFVFILILISILLFGFNYAHAITLETGGKILRVKYCYWSHNYAFLLKAPLVTPHLNGWYIYEPGLTRLYAFYQFPRPGINILGKYSPFGVCLQIKCGATGCHPIPDFEVHSNLRGTIIFMGTSF